MPYKSKEQGRVHARAYRVAHKEEIAAYLAIHREKIAIRQRAYDAIYYTTHREEHRAQASAWTKAHPQQNAEWSRRHDALKRGATIGLIDLGAIKIRDRMRCAICGKRVKEKDLSFDHSWPLSLGGPHSQENQRVSHRRCNSKRGTGRIPVQMVLC